MASADALLAFEAYPATDDVPDWRTVQAALWRWVHNDAGPVLLAFSFFLAIFSILMAVNGHVLDHGRSYLWNVRLVALVHASIALLWSGWSSFFKDWPWDHLGEPNTPLQIQTLQLSLGYFLFDLGYAVITRGETVLMMIHHVGAVSGLFFCLLIGTGGSETVAVVAGAELTNFALKTRWFLTEAKLYQGSRLAAFNDVLFTGTFFLTRVFFGTIHFYKVMASPRVHWSIKGGAVCLWSISLLWFGAIMAQWREHWRWDRFDSGNHPPSRRNLDALNAVRDKRV